MADRKIVPEGHPEYEPIGCMTKLNSIPAEYGVVSAPQFDISKFKPGTALHVRHGSDGPFRFKRDPGNCLVVNCTPLQLTLCYINKDLDDDFGDSGKLLTINITEIVDNKYTIRPLS